MVIDGTNVGDDIRVYNTAGQLLNQVYAQGKHGSYDFGSGLHGQVYIVCVNGKAARILL